MQNANATFKTKPRERTLSMRSKSIGNISNFLATFPKEIQSRHSGWCKESESNKNLTNVNIHIMNYSSKHDIFIQVRPYSFKSSLPIQPKYLARTSVGILAMFDPVRWRIVEQCVRMTKRYNMVAWNKQCNLIMIKNNNWVFYNTTRTLCVQKMPR